MNTSVLLLIVNYVLISIEVFSITYLANGFFHRKSHLPIYIASFTCLICLSIITVHLLESIPILRMALSVILDGTWIFINFETQLTKSAISGVLLVSFQWIVDTLFLSSAISITYGSDAYIYDNPFAYYTVCYAAKLVTLFFAVLIRLWGRRRFFNQATRWTDWIRVSIIPFSVVLISQYLSYLLSVVPQFSSSLFIATALLLVLDVMSILLLGHLEQQQQAILELAILHQQLKLEEDHILALEEAYTSQRKQTHDFNNQLSVLRCMAEQGAPQSEFAEYLGHILAIEFPSTSYISTHRRVVDVVLNQKKSLAKSKDIPLHLQLDDLSLFPLPDDALVVVLANLIDNAIEACEKIDSLSQRRITLKMQMKASVAFLYIENTTASPVCIHNYQIATTKDNPIAHGYGLKNVYTLLERNNASFVTKYREDGVFCFSAKIPVLT